MGVGWVSDVSADSHVAGSDNGGEDEHGPGPCCSGVRGNGSASGSLAEKGSYLERMWEWCAATCSLGP